MSLSTPPQVQTRGGVYPAMLPVLRRWLPSLNLALLPLVATLALYAPVLTLPFFWDDYPQFNFATTKSYPALCTSAKGQPTIFRNVFDRAGNVLGRGSAYALGTMLPFGALPAGTRVQDLRAIPLDTLSPDGCYQVEVALFRADGSRVPITTVDGV